LKRATDANYVDLEQQQRRYEAETGDHEDDQRFADWCVKHPRNSLSPDNDDAPERTR
jgi:hypothetical protein